jgi:hypothetical protein
MRKENKQEWMQELEDAPGLSKLAGHEPFEAPEGYFDTFSASVTDRINAAKQETWAAQLLQWIRKPIVAIPALAIIITGIILFTRSGTTDNSNQKYVAMNYDDIYNSGLINDLDESTICEFIEVKEHTVSTREEDLLLESISEESLINEL